MSGETNHFQHIECQGYDTTNGTREDICALDLRNNTDPDWEQDGKYSTHLFTEVAQKRIHDHADDNPEQVWTIVFYFIYYTTLYILYY